MGGLGGNMHTCRVPMLDGMRQIDVLRNVNLSIYIYRIINYQKALVDVLMYFGIFRAKSFLSAFWKRANLLVLLLP